MSIGDRQRKGRERSLAGAQQQRGSTAGRAGGSASGSIHSCTCCPAAPGQAGLALSRLPAARCSSTPMSAPGWDNPQAPCSIKQQQLGSSSWFYKSSAAEELSVPAVLGHTQTPGDSTSVVTQPPLTAAVRGTLRPRREPWPWERL